MHDENEKFKREYIERINSYKNNTELKNASSQFLLEAIKAKYAYNFSWLGRPVIQIPQDLFAMQEIIWETKPDFIIECGIAHGGSLIFFASMLELLGKGHVIGIDIEIRPHNLDGINNHPLSKRITLLEGSSVSTLILDKVKAIIGDSRNVFVSLDSNHTHEHVLKELYLYTPFISKGHYCVVSDTGIEDLPPEMIVDRPWKKGNSPKTAVMEFLKNNNRFIIDYFITTKLLLTSAPDGYLKCIY